MDSDIRIRLMHLQMTQDILAHKQYGIIPSLEIYQLGLGVPNVDFPRDEELECYAGLFKHGNPELREQILKHVGEGPEWFVPKFYYQVIQECLDMHAQMALARDGCRGDMLMISMIIDRTSHKPVLEFLSHHELPTMAVQAKKRLEKDFSDAN